jgi:hypothetical protein
MAAATKKQIVTVPGAQPTPDPIIARPVTVPKKTAKKKKAVITQTKVGVIMDKSGSMYSRAGDVIGGFNQYVDSLKVGEGAKDMSISLTLFDTVVTKLHNDVAVSNVPALTSREYAAGGNTALFDAIGQTVAEMERTLPDDARALVVIMTDGQNNSSREYTKATIKEMITKLETKGNWTFVFMGADQDAFVEGGGIGIAGGNTLSHSGKDYKKAIQDLSIGTQSYASNATLRATKSFFTPDD